MRGRRAWTDFAASVLQAPLFAAPTQPARRKRGTLAPPRPRETEVQKLILDALLVHPKVAWIERTNTGAGRFVGRDGKPGRFVRYGFRGQSDLSGMLRDGRVLAIEVKRPNKDLSPKQAQHLARVRAGGGVAGVARSVEDAFRIVEG